MKNRILFVILLAIVFIISSVVSANTVMIDPDKMGMVAGLGALVVGYFVSKAARMTSEAKNTKENF